MQWVIVVVVMGVIKYIYFSRSLIEGGREGKKRVTTDTGGERERNGKGEGGRAISEAAV